MATCKYKINLDSPVVRKQHIDQRAQEAKKENRTRRESKFRQGAEPLPVIQMDIDHLLYRLENFRTIGDQLSRIAAGKAEEGFFSKARREDPSVQQAQHEILFALAQKGSGESIKPIYEELKRVGEQTDELLISADGVVVNGNRRLAAMRELVASGEPNLQRFRQVACAVLPQSATDDEIVALEIELQMQPDTKLPYDWTSQALAARQLQSRKCTEDQIAKMMNRDVDDVRRLVRMIDAADLYLSDHLQTPRAYDALEETEQAFKQVASRNLARTDNVGLREITRKFDFLLIENRRQIEARAYELINNIETNPELFLDTIAATWNVDLSAAPEGQAQLKISFDDESAPAGAKNYAALTKHLDALADDPAVRSAAARAVEEASVLAGEQGKRKDQAALKFAKAARQKLDAINLPYADSATLPEVLTILATCISRSEQLMAEITTRLKGE